MLEAAVDAFWGGYGGHSPLLGVTGKRNAMNAMLYPRVSNLCQNHFNSLHSCEFMTVFRAFVSAEATWYYVEHQ